MKKTDEHQFQGMQRDMSVSKQQAQFLWEAHNIRLTARHGDTLLSITNEKGTEKAAVDGGFDGAKIIGSYMGHCVIGDYLTVFTHADEGDYIFRIHKDSDLTFSMTCLTGVVYELSTINVIGYKPLNLNFDLEHPLQTLGVFENEYIQKVYWTDGVNQPRVINIVKDSLGGNVTYNDDSFDFVPKMTLHDSVRVRKIADSSGSFGAGVIQYVVSYFNKYGQQSNISCVSPLIGTSFNSRAGSPEEKIGNSFEVTVHDPDTSFEYARIYSIFRSSIDATASCKRVADIKLSNTSSGDSSAELVVNNPASQTSARREYAFQVRETYSGEWKSCSEYKDKIQDVKINTVVGGAFYVFNKTEYPELTIRADIYTSATTTASKYITWGETATLYLSEEGQYINQQYPEVQMIYGRTSSGAVQTFLIADYINRQEYSSEGIRFVDNGAIGDDIDPQELLYIGGESITAETIEQKDGTLFLGNIKVSRPQVPDTIKRQLSEQAAGPDSSDDWSDCRYAYIPIVLNSDNYKWGNSLNAKMSLAGMYDKYGKYIDSCANVSTAGFKVREHYRLGVQFQYKTGKWSEPIFLADKTESNMPGISENGNCFTLTIPTFSATLDAESCEALVKAGYVRARGMVTLPSMQDRLVVAQGMLNPTVYSIALRNSNSPDFQSSWFFRPWPSSSNGDTANSRKDEVKYGASVEYRHNHSLYGFNNRGAEIQGVPMGWGGKEYKAGGSLPYGENTVTINIGHGSGDDYDRAVGVDQCVNIFCVDQQNVTMHSPDFEFDDSFSSLDLNNVLARTVGLVEFSANSGDIDIQTSSPVIGTVSTGFYHKALSTTNARLSDKRLCAGLFYWDWLADDKDEDTYQAWIHENMEFPFMVYPWSRTGSLNNDCNRPAGTGTRSAVLSRKVISNIKYSQDNLPLSGELKLKGQTGETNASNAIQLFDSDQVAIVKTAGLNYYGNVDMLLTPPVPYGSVFSGGGSTDLTYWNPISGVPEGKRQCEFDDDSRLWFWGTLQQGTCRILSEDMLDPKWGVFQDDESTNYNIGDKYGALRLSRETVRMKYKSTPHAVLSLNSPLQDTSSKDFSCLYLAELYKTAREDTDFGGTSDEAKQANLWIPAGEPVELKKTGTKIRFDYGDTWYQRYDCLKTYPYTEDDTNSVVEIGSFMVETHVNIDGRYDRNRGQDSNLTMRPTNFNLINEVYSQTDNFFNYRILDSDYYDLTYFPSMVTWATMKNNAAEVDPWTTVTLASTLELDGVKGAVTDLVTNKDTLYAFQERGITQILFNSRVAISTSDNVPIEISNNYKVDGDRYISTSVGCASKFAVAKSPSGVYFVDSISHALYLLNGDQLANVSDTHGFGYWFSQQDTGSLWQLGRRDEEMSGARGTALYYDMNKKDLYITTPDETLCYSELLGQFTSFLSYEGGALFNIGSTFHALTNKGYEKCDLWNMFEGTYNSYFYDKRQTDITFISNAESVLDKTFTNLEIRGDFYDESGELQHERFFDSIRVWDEYQDTADTALTYKPYPYTTASVGSNLKKKFRIWRCDIPRAWKNGKRSMDRIRNTWCKIQLTMNKDAENPLHMETHDIGVIYYT